MENRSSSSGRSLEVGGLLVGWIEQYYPLRVRVEDFEPIICEHCGPYALSDAERQVLEQAIKRPRTVGLEVIGFFRSYCSHEPVLNTFDQELFTAYFSNRSDVLLLLQFISPADCRATFRFGDDFSPKPGHPFIPFYEGMSRTEQSTAVPKSLPVPASVKDVSDKKEESLLISVLQQDSTHDIKPPPGPESEILSHFGIEVTSRNRLPWLAAVASVLLLIPAYIGFTGSRKPHSVVAAPKPAATQTSQPPVVAHATAPSGQPAPPASGPTPSPDPVMPSLFAKPVVAVPPEIRKAVQPEIPFGIRARIMDPIAISVRVRVSSSGTVMAAVLQGGAEKDGLHQYLRSAASKAALAWSFEPAKTKEGIPIMAEREISFTFDPQ